MFGIIEWKMEVQIHFATTTTFALQVSPMVCFVVFLYLPNVNKGEFNVHELHETISRRPVTFFCT